MFTVRFVGRLFHSPINLYLESPTLTLDDPELGHSGENGQKETHYLKIENGEAVLTCSSTHYDEVNRIYIYIRALHFTKACLALHTFSTGLGGTVSYERSIEPDGSVRPIAFFKTSLQALCKSYSLPNNFNEMLRLGVQHQELMYAIIDVTQAISEPASFALGGARAIERLRSLVAGPSLSREEAWPLLCKALQVDKAYLTYITAHSRAPRHGQDFTHTSEIQNTVIERCWTLIDRSVEYLRRNREPLPLDLFPLLTG